MLSLKLPRLLSAHQVPKGYQEQGILFGYRPPRSSATDCLLSVFQMTNETLNIWTHFLPAWYFAWTLLGRLQGWDDPQAWPLLAYLLTCCIYPLASSCAHTFSTMSSRARHICYFFDYAALSMYSLGSALAYSAYVFPLEWVGTTFHHCYVPVAMLNSILSTSLSCYSSHQVFHVCGILGTHFQMEAIMLDMAERQGQVLLPSRLHPLSSLGVCVASSLAVIGLCSVSLRRIPEPPHRDKPHGL
ncbi:membrane progestin receptor gamma [Willisornis vidua]|uniref:Membrane progestin receptor gamma n=1 Tax=Willisornis vidua TaxID=1566151 RepID=A0ABQ9DEC5_9PASS|nr:membrane progestin receptor gamma [Willisornis vidua]